MAAMLDAIDERGGDIVNCMVEIHADGRIEIGDWPPFRD
jgi:hypothetical protein